MRREFACTVFVMTCGCHHEQGLLFSLFFHNSYILNLNFLFFIFVSPVCANGMLISAQRASTVAAPSVGVFIFYFFLMNSAAFVSSRQRLVLKDRVCIFLFFSFFKKHYIWDFIYLKKKNSSSLKKNILITITDVNLKSAH